MVFFYFGDQVDTGNTQYLRFGDRPVKNYKLEGGKGNRHECY